MFMALVKTLITKSRNDKYFFNMAKNNPTLNVKGSLKRFRDFIYIDDVVEAWYKIALDKKFLTKFII